MALTGTQVDDVREDLEALRRRIVSEIVDLNHHLPGRRLSRRDRLARFFKRQSSRRRWLLGRFTG